MGFGTWCILLDEMTTECNRLTARPSVERVIAVVRPAKDDGCEEASMATGLNVDLIFPFHSLQKKERE